MSTERRILAVTSEPPWPLNSGGRLRTYHLLAALARAFEHVTLVVPAPRDDFDGRAAIERTGARLELVPVGPRSRLGELRRGGRALVRSEPYVFFNRHHWTPVRQRLAALMQQHTPDAVYFDHLDGFLYSDLARGPRQILDLHNVYSTLLERTADGHRHPLMARLLRWEAARVARMEKRAIAAVDLTFSVSDDDAAVFRGWSARRVEVVPNGVDAAAYASLPVGRETSSAPRLLFVGALSWPPNAVAVRTLATDILGRVRTRYPQAEAHLVGRAPTLDVLALASIPGVKIFADVPDVRPFLASATLLVVPLDAGGGTRLKILEAFAAGLPVISTPVGCEGIDAIDGTHLLVAEQSSLADAVLAALGNDQLCRTLASHGRTLVEASYDWQSVGRRATDAIAKMLNAPS